MPHTTIVHNPAALVGMGRHRTDPDLARLLRAAGVEEAYITGGTSDYDRFSALADALPFCKGHPLCERVQAALTAAMGGVAPLCPHTASLYWTRWVDLHWYRKDHAPIDSRLTEMSCPLCAAESRSGVTDIPPAAILPLPDPLSLIQAGDGLADWTARLQALLTAAPCLPYAFFSLPPTYTFIRPDPYHAAEAIRAVADRSVAHVDDRARDLLLTQALRIWGETAAAASLALLVQIRQSANILPLLDYLHTVDRLPSMVLLPSDDADPRILAPLVGLYASVRTGLMMVDASESPEMRQARLGAYEKVAPSGRRVQCVKGER